MPHRHAACRAILVTCIDYRIVGPLHGMLADRGLAGGVDVVSWPGGALRLGAEDGDAVFEAVAIADKLHAPEELVLATHHDCGWLGGSEQFVDVNAEAAYLDGRLDELAAAARERFPHLRVTRVRIDIDGNPHVVEGRVGAEQR